MAHHDLANEWQLLQNQFDNYEMHSLYIKLLTVTLFLIAYSLDRYGVVIMAVMLVLWLQDAIWKTFQGRIEQRLLALEQQLSSDEPTTITTPYRYNLNYLASRPSTTGLIKEYARQALRPTVAFPYLILIIISVALTPITFTL
jgi:hypothetical protein